MTFLSGANLPNEYFICFRKLFVLHPRESMNDLSLKGASKYSTHLWLSCAYLSHVQPLPVQQGDTAYLVWVLLYYSTSVASLHLCLASICPMRLPT